MLIFQEWINNIKELGVVQGYATNADMYPPLILPIWAFVSKFGFRPFVVLRITNSICILISMLLIRVLYNSKIGSIIFFFMMLISEACGYLEIVLAPHLILFFYFLKKRNYWWTGFFASIMCLIKFQPIVFMPLILISFVDFSFKRINVEYKSLLYFLFGSFVPIFVSLIIWGFSLPQALMRGLSLGNGRGALSANALNFGWIFTFILERFFPQIAGGLDEGRICIIFASQTGWIYYFKYLFWMMFIVLIVLLLFCKKSYSLILEFVLIEYTSYCIFNTNVHENHIILGGLLVLMLYLEQSTKENLYKLIMYMIMINMNLVIFYGISGVGLGFSRVLMNRYDISIFFAVVNVFFFVSYSFKFIIGTFKNINFNSL